MYTELLTQLAIDSIRATKIGSSCLEESTEIVVFGSRSVGLERADSDIDVLCIGNFNFKLKTAQLDLNAIRAREVGETHWLNSELASHIAHYGTWIRGVPEWIDRVEIGQSVVQAKRRRLAAFMRALPDRWRGLEEGFRQKYATKLRRETQRLLLLERGTPIPPTRMLDTYWDNLSISPREVQGRLQVFSNSHRTCFEEDLWTRIGEAFQAR
jgi:predicted nucleotidyltransferase